MHLLWWGLDIHRRFGPWKCSEPISHLKFSFESVWIVALFTLGNEVVEYLLDIDPVKKIRFTNTDYSGHGVAVEPNLARDVVFAVLGFYSVDFLRYWAHRVGHWAFFYYTFPFVHGHHHNQLFVNPMTFVMSPMLHLASWATYFPCWWLAYNNYQNAALICWSIVAFSNVTQHLGFDPCPMVTRWNHYYFSGALPWVPIYHMYHHNPFVRAGNFGNTTVLFDYLFDTVIPECAHHIETGSPPEWLAEKFRDPEKLNRTLEGIQTAGEGKNRLDMNDRFDWSIFQFYLR